MNNKRFKSVEKNDKKCNYGKLIHNKNKINK